MVNEERATVLAVEGGKATLELERSERCGTCGLCSGAAGTLRLTVDAVPGLKPGQKVVIAIDRSVSLRSVLLLFGLPLAGLVVGAVVGHTWPFGGLTPDVCSVILAGALLVVSFLVARACDRRTKGASVQPAILRIESP